MDLIFMLTRDDLTVPDCLDVVEEALATGVRHVGFKDRGVPQRVLVALHERLRQAGATTYFEVVSETPEDCLRSAAIAAELGVDCLLGGKDLVAMAGIVAGTGMELYPFAGVPQGHPTRLGGSVSDIAQDCRAYVRAGAAGIDLLAYRATDADPEALVEAAREALEGRRLIVAGSIASADRARRMATLGVDGITVGTAIFDGSFAPVRRGVRAQLEAALASVASS